MRIRLINLTAILLIIWSIALGADKPIEQSFDLDQLGSGDPIEQLLSRAGLDYDSLQLPMSQVIMRLMTSPTSLRSPGLFLTLAEDPMRASWHLMHYRQRIFYAKEYLRKIIMYMSARINVSVYRGYHSNPWREIEENLKSKPDPLLFYIEQIYEAYGTPLSAADREQLSSHVKHLPEELHIPIATLLAFSHSALGWQKLAFEDWREGRHKDEFTNLTMMPQFNPDFKGEAPDIRRMLQRVDYTYLCAGAEDITEGIDRALPLLAKIPSNITTDTLTWHIKTPLGGILINWGDRDDTYEIPRGDNMLLLLDFGGNDTYICGAANESTSQPISLLIDLGGDDFYTTRDRYRPCFGSGIGGYGVLIDTSGNDKYISGHFSQGASLLGVGILRDLEGDDSYSALQMSQAAAMGGLALLYDGGGSDKYRGLTEVQGYGSAAGFGLLMDDTGNDEYLCDNEPLFAPSAQAPKYNSSLGQGAGKGFRADLSDGHSIPGGTGMLLDEEGDDTYSAGVMAQGVGFWNGAGVLLDMKGNDRYDGAYYVQGVGIHSAVGVLCDYDGNDTYTAHLYIAQGSGHDYSVGYLLDEKGDDTYISPPMAPGTANQNSIGVFLERTGNDIYRSSEQANSYGRAKMSKWGTPGEDGLNVGLFLELGGEDSYPADRGVRNNSWWVQEPEYEHIPRLESQWGLGLDGEYDRLYVPLHPITPYTPDD